MTTLGLLQIALFALCTLAMTPVVGAYLLRTFDGRFRWLSWIERPLYRAAGIDPGDGQDWRAYAISLLAFSAVGTAVTYLALRVQGSLPLNPQGLVAVVPRQAFETSVSFATNTNWQSYVGETTMSYLSQMGQLAFHNFASAAAGLGVAIALTRGIARRREDGEAGAPATIGNFWVDLVRGTLYVLLPGSLLLALLFVSQGVIQTFAPALVLQTVEGARQVLALGPVASQEAIKQLGTNGGGFFNANSAHPFENPTPFANWLQMLAIFAIPAGLTWTFGRMVRAPRHGWSLWAAMMLLFAGGAVATYAAEARGNPLHAARGVDVRASDAQPGGNMEGKEVRFGIASSTLFATVTTDASCGAVNAMHDSFTPLGGLVPMVNMQLGEVIFGGVGAGLYGMLVMVVITVFIAGLMVGRTPEYLGKRIRSREIRMAMLYALVFPVVVLPLTALALAVAPGLAGLNNAGPHGLSEVLYAFTSTGANNGSAFAGLNGGTTFYNVALGLAMLAGRFAMIVPALALAGFLAEQEPAPATSGSFPVSGPLFVVLLIGVIGIVGALTFFPALALGPVVEHLSLASGRLF